MALPTGVRPKFSKYHMTTKAGIYTLALASSLFEAFTLPEPLLYSIKVCGGKELYDRIMHIQKFSIDGFAEYMKSPKLADKV